MHKTCDWPSGDPLMIRYHDEEWGVPVHDDRKHFEFILLDCFQAGLSWRTILHKRDNFRKAFDDFDYRKVARYDEGRILSLLEDPGIIRNRAKVRGTVNNAIRFVEVIREYGTFDDYIWGFVGRKPIINHWKSLSDMPSHSPESDAMSKDLIKRGFRFAGSTICYSYMQAAGMVNDHLVQCFRHPSNQQQTTEN